MKTVKKIKDLQKTLRRIGSKPIRFVPTMGSLHEGHLSLIRAAKKAGGTVVVSIFVNPLQFGPKEDLKNYPRNISRDTKLLKKEGVHLLFTPSVTEMYPDGETLTIEEEDVSKRWCGKVRPGHFKGVLIVVAKLFGLVQPKSAYFGQKDFQQCFLIQKMTRNLFQEIEIKRIKTAREADGLAKSSRNVYLSKRQRKGGCALVQSLRGVKDAFLRGEKRASRLSHMAKQKFHSYPAAKLEYIGFASGKTLAPVKKIKKGDVVLIAAHLGKTRLIDNWIVGEKI